MNGISSLCRRFCRVFVLGVVAVVGVGAWTSSALAAERLPRPKVGVEGQGSVRGAPTVLVRSVSVRAVKAASITIRCSGCGRRGGGRIVKRKLRGGGEAWSNVNWLAGKRHRVTVKVTMRGRVGWLFTLGLNEAKRNPKLVTRHVGCLSVGGRGIKCPTRPSNPTRVIPKTPPVPATPPAPPVKPPQVTSPSPKAPTPVPVPVPVPTQPTTRVITVDNRVTNGGGMREDTTPVRLTTQPWVRCGSRGCNINGTERSSGGTYASAICQTTGERTTNGDDTSTADDSNPLRFESTRYYGVRLSNGTFGYVSETWIRAADRGGLGLSGC